MLTLKQLFQADGLNLPEDEIKLVRHGDHLSSFASCKRGGYARDELGR